MVSPPSPQTISHDDEATSLFGELLDIAKSIQNQDSGKDFGRQRDNGWLIISEQV